jgi:hypothetical protein
MEQNNKVSVGVTSIIGWLTALLALLPTIITSVQSGTVAFNGPEKFLAIVGIASGLITQIGRYLQAHKLITKTESVSLPSAREVVDGFEEGNPKEVVRPESAATPDPPKAEISQ